MAALNPAGLRATLRRWRGLVVAGGFLLAAAVATAQDAPESGRRIYLEHCASCHGARGLGDGPVAPHLVKPPTDLTLLARRNGGIFPVRRTAETIDGRGSSALGPHGSREMPVWGDVFRSQATQAGAAPIDLEWYSRGRMLLLIDHLARIQQR